MESQDHPTEEFFCPSCEVMVQAHYTGISSNGMKRYECPNAMPGEQHIILIDPNAMDEEQDFVMEDEITEQEEEGASQIERVTSSKKKNEIRNFAKHTLMHMGLHSLFEKVVPKNKSESSDPVETPESQFKVHKPEEYTDTTSPNEKGVGEDIDGIEDGFEFDPDDIQYCW